MATDKNIDPRFDPVFQRGYAAGEGGEREENTRAARNVDSYRQPVTNAVAPSATRAFAEETAPLAGVAATGSPSAPRTSPLSDNEQPSMGPQSQYLDDAAASVAPVATRTPTGLARNPWIYVLWAVGGGLMAGGVGGLWWAFKGLYGRGTINENSWELFNLAQVASPICITAGAFCVASALLVHCLDWMRRNP
ncbi:hypothetical protein I6E74_03220 [Salinibacterium sp. SWN139]|uniref:hypothetical protein n=1 Tax=Salinibacterium sp. SWN139 TaxID=2792055 RepID=UPI0018CCD9DA|nr:hypothetical protein [Salinibacterium sp. SWN139]MBH0053178.1 hypothetical protein [Salinibacterium sp. SWN139]